MKMENKKVLPGKIAKYSLMAGAALSLLNSCGKDEDEDPITDNPNVEVTDLTPDISLLITDNGFLDQGIDINGDGIIDVNLYISNNNYGLNYNINSSGLFGYGGAEILGQDDFFDWYGVDTFKVVSPLSAGSTIGAAQSTWTNDYPLLGETGDYYGTVKSIGQFLGQDKYVGVRFQAAGNTHYAWIQVSLSEDGSNVVVKKHAYHTTPNTAIKAGEE